MSEPINGAEPLPKISVAWDADKKAVSLEVDFAQFKNWDFILAVLEMAKSVAENHKKMSLLAQAQAQAQMAQRDQAIAQRVSRGLQLGK